MLKSGAIALIAFSTAAWFAQPARAADTVRINIPARSRLTPVQRLNREGVQEVKKHAYEKAEAIFYKAYLYDPSDPFTLNNLGYVSELQGQLDQAQKFYHLAAEQGCDANIDLSDAKHLEGKPMRAAVVDLQDTPMKVNRMNIDAMRLLSQDRGFEAVALLRRTLALDPRNPFTLTNLGVADEAIGNYDDAVASYHQAAETRATDPVVIALDRSWRGKSVSAAAAESEKRLRRRMQNTEATQERAAMYTVQGVYAINQNDWTAARKDFLQAYSLDPWSAFSLNNLGYVAEKDGDMETAQFFYGKALKALNADARVGLATELAAQGEKISAVSNESDTKVDGALDVYSRARRQQNAPVELTPRENSPAESPSQNPQ